MGTNGNGGVAGFLQRHSEVLVAGIGAGLLVTALLVGTDERVTKLEESHAHDNDWQRAVVTVEVSLKDLARRVSVLEERLNKIKMFHYGKSGNKN